MIARCRWSSIGFGLALGIAAVQVLRMTASAGAAEPTRKWDYRCVPVSGLPGQVEEKVKPLGTEGWELTTVDDRGVYCFKRPL